MSFDDSRENEDLDDLPLKLRPDETPVRSKALAPPPDYTSRAIRLRLLTLVVTLGLVIVAMREAGKPERWEWMGFDRADQAKAAQADRPQTSGDAVTDVNTPLRLNDQPSELQPIASAAPYPAAAVRFWAAMIRKMDSQQHQDLFRFLKCLREGQPIELLQQAPLAKIVKILIQQRKLFHRDLLDQISMLPADNADKQRLANELFESEQVWDKKILPAFNAGLAGDDFSVSQLRQLERLQRELDPLVFATVADHMPIGWDGDSASWIRMWDQIIERDITGTDPIPVTHLQLSSQPDFYRGRLVSVAGWVRSARRETKQDSELGVPHYYQLIVRPADSKITPYCIYALQLPEDFPAVGDHFVTLNQRIDATGLFFKIRTYVDSAKEVSESPVLLANQIVCVPDSQVLSSTFSATSISLTTWLVCFGVLLIFAVTVAWLAFYSSQTHRFQPGKNKTAKINQVLTGLAENPDVQTDVEKIRELYE